MKSFILSLITILCAITYFRTLRFDNFDLNGTQFEITWDEITDDLWP